MKTSNSDVLKLLLNMDRRYNIFGVLDTETGKKGYVNDFAIKAINKDNEVIEFRFLIKETLRDDMPTSKKAYYEKLIKDKEVPVISVKQLRTLIQMLVESGVRMCAFCASFDNNHLNDTFEDYGVEPLDFEIDDLAALTSKICYTPEYIEFIEKNNLRTEKGKIPSSVEAIGKYLTNQPDYIELHTALSDVEMETRILQHCIKLFKGKPLDWYGKRPHWRTLNKYVAGLQN